MVTIKSMEVQKSEIELTPMVTVDMEIIEYFYAATFEDITGDDDLMDLILTNGFYKQALCDAHGIQSLVLEHKGKEHKLRGTEHNIPSTLEVFEGKTKLMPLNVKIKNG